MQVGSTLVVSGLTAALSGVLLDAAGDDHGTPQAVARTLELVGGASVLAGAALLGRGAPRVLHDALVGAGELRPHQVDAAGLALRDATSSTPGRWYHATSPGNRETIVADGVRIPVGSSNAYGDGHYLSSRADAGYGAGIVAESVDSRAPFVVHEREVLDIAGFARTVQPLVDRFVAAHPDVAARMERSQLVRESLRDAGHDSILVMRNRFSDRWLVALDEQQLRVVTRQG